MLARVIGIILMGIGAGVGWYFVLGPVEAARAGAPEVQMSIKAFVLAPLAATTGLLLLLGGNRMLSLLSGPPETREQKLLMWVVLTAMAVASLGGWWWFESEMDRLGYGF